MQNYRVGKRTRGEWTAPVGDFGTLAILQRDHYDPKSGVYDDPLTDQRGKSLSADPQTASKVDKQLEAIKACDGLVLLQAGKWNKAGTALDFDGWAGIWRVENAERNDAGGLRCRFVDRIAEAR